MPKLLELFAGTSSVGDVFRSHGWEVYTVDWDEQFDVTLHADIGSLTAEDCIKMCGGKPDVIWASPDCFLAGTLVWTDRGYVPIEEIKCMDMVLTHKGRFKRVYRTIKKNDRKFVKLKISGVEEMLVTPNHPFYARKKMSVTTRKDGKPFRKSWLAEPEWINAENLTTEYRVGIPINTNEIIPKWDGVVKKYCNTYGPTRCEIVNTLSPLMSNSDFWWVVGNYFADGSLSKEKGTITISYGKDCEKKKIIKGHLDNTNIKYSERDCGTSGQFNICSLELCEFMSQFGVGALNKSITPTILDLPIDLLRQFLDGYFFGDGHIDRSTDNPQMGYTTISKNLAYGLRSCLLKAYHRYPSLVKVDKESINAEIEGRKVNVHDAYACSYYLNESNRLQYTIEDNMAWVNVRSAENITTDQQSIYTLSVEDDESYTVYDLAVHNCSSYSVASMGHHRRKNKETGELDPQTDYARMCDRVNAHVLELIEELSPRYFFIENPRAGLRTMRFMLDRERDGFMVRYTTTYCQWGDRRMKPTDIWTNHPNPRFKTPCRYGDPCHERAPRGSKCGTQAIKGARDRARIPARLCEHVYNICQE